MSAKIHKYAMYAAIAIAAYIVFRTIYGAYVSSRVAGSVA